MLWSIKLHLSFSLNLLLKKCIKCSVFLNHCFCFCTVSKLSLHWINLVLCYFCLLFLKGFFGEENNLESNLFLNGASLYRQDSNVSILSIKFCLIVTFFMKWMEIILIMTVFTDSFLHIVISFNLIIRINNYLCAALICFD